MSLLCGYGSICCMELITNGAHHSPVPRHHIVVMVASDFMKTNITNIAHLGRAKQSSTYQGAVASRAIDGNTIGIFRWGKTTHTQNRKLSWWQLDYDNEVTFDKVFIDL